MSLRSPSFTPEGSGMAQYTLLNVCQMNQQNHSGGKNVHTNTESVPVQWLARQLKQGSYYTASW